MPNLTAILLCGGKGERLRPFTDTLPKPLVPLRGRPLLYHLVKHLADGGIRRFVFCVGYRAEAIQQFVRDNSESGWSVNLVDSGDASITDRILDARKYVTGSALVCYGDTLANVDLVLLQKQHATTGALATLTVYPLHSPFGIVNFDVANRVIAFAEKPKLPHWINIGFLLCAPKALDLVTPNADLPTWLSTLLDAGVLYAYEHTGKHLTVNTEKDRVVAENEIVEFYTHTNGQII